MSFVYALALGVGFLVAAPYLAHRLRRKRADEREFAAAHLVPPAPPTARRKAALEDRALFGIRALAVVALALLGASPLIRCSRLSLQRSGGASVAMAIVLDDSMSMRALDANARGERFDRAKRGARELLASAREGDAVAVVLAGTPARVALAATTDIAAARAMLDSAVASDRATDLDGAIGIARALITQLPQVDRRVVVLSDLADGNPNGPPIGDNSPIPVWVALPELAQVAVDCAVLTADRAGTRVRAHVQCTAAPTPGRELTIAARIGSSDTVLARAPLPTATEGDVALTLAGDAPNDLVAKLTGVDAIAADDVAPVVYETGSGAIAVVADTQDESAATGGAPVVEQALSALKVDIAVRPIPQVPDRAEDLAPFVGVILDDPPGLTPEQRRALAGFFDTGGVALLALGPRAAAAPLGATFEPMLGHAVAWTPSGAPTITGVDAARATGVFAESAASLVDLGARERAVLAPDDLASLESQIAWSDGPPLIGRRAVGRGSVWVVTLPFAVGASDLTLRPGFLTLLDSWLAEARLRAAPRRGDVGAAWTFPGAKAVTIEGPSGPVAVSFDATPPRAVPPAIGAYRVTVDGKSETRVAAAVAREVDLRPRTAAATSRGEGVGETRASVDISWIIALVLLGLLAGEMGLRVVSSARARAAT